MHKQILLILKFIIITIQKFREIKMTKESTNNPYADFRETFNSYSDIINNGGTNNGVTLSNGVATFDGSSIIHYNNKNFTVQKLSAFSIRIKLTTSSDVTTAARLFYSDGILNGSGSAKFTITISNGIFSAYINTVGGGGGGDSAVMNIAANTSYDIVMTYDGTSIRLYNDGSIEDTETHAFGGAVFDYADILHIGGKVSDQFFDGTMDLFEGYYYVLSAEEVSALHKNILYTEPSSTGEVLNVNANRGAIVDEYGNAITNTAVTVVQDSTKVMNFDGSISYLDMGAGTQSSLSFIQNTYIFTMAIWVKLTNVATRQVFAGNLIGSGDKGYIFMWETVGGGFGTQAIRFVIYKATGSAMLDVHSNNSATITDNNYHRVLVTSSGVGNNVTFYVDGLPLTTTYKTSFQSVSTGDSTRNLFVGAGNNAGTPALILDGDMNDIIISSRHFSAEEVARDFNSSKNRYLG